MKAEDLVKELKEPYNCIVKTLRGDVCITDVKPGYSSDWLFGKCKYMSILSHINIEWKSEKSHECFVEKENKKPEEDKKEESIEDLIKKVENHISASDTFEKIEKALASEDLKETMLKLKEIESEKYLELRGKLSAVHKKLKNSVDKK